jgi:gas vesicle protein
MFPFLIPALCAAVGAAAGAIAAHSSGEKDRQKAKHLNQVNNDLINKKNDLEKRYYELKDKNKQEVNDRDYKLAKSELEKDALFIAIRLQNDLMCLMEALDRNPSWEVLEKFQDAIVKTNGVLKEVGENLVPISQDYFDRQFDRIKLIQEQRPILQLQARSTSTDFTNRASYDSWQPQTTLLFEEKSTSIFGNIACPHCHQQNKVTKKISSIRCTVCNGFIDLVSRYRQIEWNKKEEAFDEEKSTFSSDGTITCPLCDRSNEVNREMKLLNCNSCGALIHLVVKRHQIQWH